MSSEMTVKVETILARVFRVLPAIGECSGHYDPDLHTMPGTWPSHECQCTSLSCPGSLRHNLIRVHYG